LYENETIAAISTPLGEGGIGIVRLSGPDAFSIAMSIFNCSKSEKPGFPEPRKLYHGYIYEDDQQIIDEVLVSFMPAPYTYTREDIAEINCHSGIITLRAILRLIIKAGARLAEPGEFTKRAYLHGRIDLSQAEAVLNIIKSRSEEALKIAGRALQGELSRRIGEIRDILIATRAPLEASFDYPEEFTSEEIERESINKKIVEIIAKSKELLINVERSRAMQEGVSIAIIGRPNVGKSSLLNALMRQQRAIVHEMPGTTRDLLEGQINLGGYPLLLVDTAGIQGSEDPVEKEGISRSRKAAEKARLLLVVLDGSKEIANEDREIFRIISQDQGLIIVINKSDLEQRLSVCEIKETFKADTIVKTSAITGEGIDELEKTVANKLDQILGYSDISPIVVSIRHEEIIKQALSHLESALEQIDENPLEITSLELKNAWHKLGEITGETLEDQILDKIFSEFCLGK
jgi:tRNA modification GTPase